MRRARWIVGLGFVGCAGCLAIAGLDEDYTVGQPAGGTGGSSSATMVTSGSGASAGSSSVGQNAGGQGVGGQGVGGQGAGGQGGTSSSGGSGGSGTEDCLDGVDNDGNALADCADPACQPAYECVPDATASAWQGYYQLTTSSFPATPQACPDNSNPEVVFSGPGAAAQCAACGCGTATGTCSYPSLGLWGNSNDCNGGQTYTYTPNDGNCHTFPVNCGNTCSFDQRASITTPSSPVNPPSCPASGGAATIGDMWNNEHHACQLPSAGGGCNANEVCVPKQSCVRQAAALACPLDWSKALATFSSATDTRDCSMCTCDETPVSCSGGEFVVSDDNACMGGTNPDVTISGNSCVSLQNLLDQSSGSYRAVAGTLMGNCTPQGGQPTGSVTPSGPVTFCCRP
jgi:hypothetical protein